MSFNDNEEDGNGDGEFTKTVDKELIDSIINEPLEFENLDIEEDVNDLEDILKNDVEDVNDLEDRIPRESFVS